MDKGGFSSTEQNNKTIVDAMESQTKIIIEEIVSKTELLPSKVTDGSGTNFPNLMDIATEEEEEGGSNKCFDECFDDEVLYLRGERKWEVSLDQTKRRKATVVYHHRKLNFYPLITISLR